MRFFTSVFVLSTLFLLPIGCGKKAAAPTAPVEENPQVKVEASTASTDAFNKAIADLKNKKLERRTAGIRILVQYEPADAIPSLLEALADKSFTDEAAYPGEPNSTREAAVLALLQLGPTAEKALIETGLPILVAGLKDPNIGIREHAALAIGLIGLKAKSAVDPLAKLCADEHNAVRYAAYDSLKKLGGISAAIFVPLLSDKNATVAYDAARTLNGLRPLSKEIIPKLIEVLKAPLAAKESDDAVLTRMEVAEALSSFGQEAEAAVPVLIGVLNNTTEEEFVKFHAHKISGESPAMMALRKIGKPSVSALTEALQSEKSLVRWQAARILGGIGPDANAALPALQKAFTEEFKRTDAGFHVVSATALAQAQLGGDPKEAVVKVAELLKNEDPKLRFETAKVLARFGPKAEGAVANLILLLDDPQEAIRIQAVETLRAIGSGAKAAVPALGKKLADENPAIRQGAVIALKALGPFAVEAVTPISKLLGGDDEGIRCDALEALAAIGPGAKAAVPDLIKLLKGSDKERKLSMAALAAIGPDAKSALPDLLPLFSDGASDTRLESIKTVSLLRSASPEVISALTARLKKDPRLQVKVAAVRALATLGTEAKSAAPDLKEFGKSTDPAATVWTAVALFRMSVEANANLQIVVSALKNKLPGGKSARLAAIDAADLLGPAAKSVLPELIDALKDKTPIFAGEKIEVRQRAATALGKMGPEAKTAVPSLTALLKETDPTLKRTVLEALGQLGPTAEFASARLREIVRTEPAFAEAAQAALERIEKE